MNIAIVYSPDWIEHVKVLVYSIFKHNPVPVKVYLISDGDEKPDMTSLVGDTHTVQYINAESMFNMHINQLNVSTRFTKYALYRLLLPRMITDDRLLYLDADTIVMGDLTELYNMDLGSNFIAGVIDSGADTYGLKELLGLSDSDHYVNGGVMLMDLKTIRECGSVEDWIYNINHYPYTCGDQCVINQSCREYIAVLDPKWNVSLSTVRFADDARIVHYAGYKPWNNSLVDNYHVWSQTHDEYQSMKAFKPQIPKIIHFCWFGGRPKPDIVLKCIASWKKYMPDYVIHEWNETNFNVNSYPYTRGAYHSGMYAFVTDFVRLWALQSFGGIYMDADVEVLKPLDKFLHHKAFTGHETDELMVTAVMGSVPHHPWIQHMMSYYEDRNFEAYQPNTVTITKQSQHLIRGHWNGHRFLKDDVVIYPVETFCPYDHVNMKPTPTANSYAIHHFAGTWLGRTTV